MGSNPPLEIHVRAKDHGDRAKSNSNIDVIELQRGAHDRPKAAPKQTLPKELHFPSIEEILKSNVTDRNNKSCTTELKKGEIPILKPGQMSNGCEYTTAAKYPLATSIYNNHRDSAVRINAKSDSGSRLGSGVMVGKEKDSCLVLTDVHVTNGLNVDRNVSSINITTSGGEKFPATIRKLDPSHDLALVNVKTGKDTERVCKPVVVAKDQTSMDPANKMVTLSYPEQSSTLYASPGTIKDKPMLINTFGDKSGIKEAPFTFQFSEVIRGENTGRTMVRGDSQVYQGSSGGGTFNKAGELIGVVSRTKGGETSLITPVTADVVDRMKK